MGFFQILVLGFVVTRLYIYNFKKIDKNYTLKNIIYINISLTIQVATPLHILILGTPALRVVGAVWQQ